MKATCYVALLLVLLTAGISHRLLCISNLAPNDPYPVFSSVEPHDFLTLCLKREFKGEGCPEGCPDVFRISFSPFGQWANCKTDFFKFDVDDRWNVLGLFYDRCARQELLSRCGLDITPDLLRTCTDLFDPAFTDTSRRFGFLEAPFRYRKYGVRVEAEWYLGWDLTLKVQGGLADMRQTAALFDLTCSATGQSCPVKDCNSTMDTPDVPCSNDNVIPNPDPDFADSCANDICCIDFFNCACKTLLIDHIMKRINPIAKTLGLDAHEFHELSLEDTRLSLNWRHVFPVNECNPCWPYFLFMPFISLESSFPTGKQIPHCKLLGLSFGNDGHFAVASNVGFMIDFVNSIEVGLEAGLTYFVPKTHAHYPVPTHEFQETIFPRLVTLCVKPGYNWNFGATLNDYHFLEHLSAYVQYVYVAHSKDCYKIVCDKQEERCRNKWKMFDQDHRCPSPLLRKLRDRSEFEVHLLNIGFNYDIASFMTLGVFTQVPLARRNAYRSATLMGTLTFRY
jgi:hypothetical protein